jgi:hypothetical protein
MRKWLYDRPWIWIVVMLTLLVGFGGVVLVIAEKNKPTIVKPRTSMVVPLEAESFKGDFA